MKELNKILCGIDFTRAAESALKTALHFTQKFGSEIILIHVIPTIEDKPINKTAIRKAAVARLVEVEKRIKKEGVKTERLAFFGIPFEAIVDQAEIHDVSLIFIGSGEGGKKGDLLGITAENTIRVSEKPVWMVKNGARPKISRILCPIDFSEPSRRALLDAIFLARQYKAELTIMTVIEKLSTVYFAMAMPPANIRQDWMKRERSRFLKFLQDFDLNGIVWNNIARQGKPHEEILKMAGQHEYDLIVMGSLGRTGLTKILLGSTTEKVVRGLPCSILISKQEGISGAG